MTHLVVDGVRWCLSPLGQSLLSADDLRLATHLPCPTTRIIKNGEHRTVYRMERPSGAIYWKHCKLNGPRAWCREVLRGPKAMLEFRQTSELLRRGIATIEPLAWGKFDGRWPRGSYLITRALEDAVPLDEYLASHAQASPGWRFRMTEAIARFVSRLHDAGVLHPDLHPGNVLVRDQSGEPELFLIDVHDVVLSGSLSESARRENLVLLNRFFQIRSHRSDRLRFWRSYAGADRDAIARRIEADTGPSNAHLWAGRDRRCLKNNRSFYRVASGRVAGMAVRELDREQARPFLEDPDAPFSAVSVTLHKDSRSSTVCEVSVTLVDGPRPMFYKRLRAKKLTDIWANVVRPSPALRSWMMGNALLDRGLPTARPILHLHRYSYRRPATGYLLCEKVCGAQSLHERVAVWDHGTKRQMIDRIARLVRLMHERGISHRDLKAPNVLVDDHGQIVLIDLVGARVHRLTIERRRQRDVARLAVSFIASPHATRTDMLRFLRIYLVWGLRGSDGWKQWWKAIALLVSAKIARNARNNRPLS